jgi:acyl carrier protein
MSEQESRLIRCFASVFPGLTPEEIKETRADSSGIWDSLAGVTLTAVVEEEFGVEIDPAVMPELDSFEAFRNYVERQAQLKGGGDR